MYFDPVHEDSNCYLSTSDGLDGFDRWLADEPSNEDDIYYATWEELEAENRRRAEFAVRYGAA